MLPKIDMPRYMITLPLSQRKIEYRPFVVKEQRNLLMAMEAGDAESIQRSVKTILENCTVTEGIQIESLPIIDVEYYFLHLRAKSVGEIVEAKYRCNNEVDGKPCGHIMETEINIDEVKVEKNANIKTDVQVSDSIMVKLKYPDFSFIAESLKFDDLNQLTFHMVAKSIEYIYDGEQYYYANEVPIAELVEFVENLSQPQFAKIEEFFKDLPKLRKELNLTCKKCAFQHKIIAEGLESFFA